MARRHQEPLESGLVEPRFAHGFDPKAAPKWRPPPKPSPWRRHMELARAHPAMWNGEEWVGGWILVAEAKKRGIGPYERTRMLYRDRGRIEGYLRRNHPLERWELRTLTVADTVCDRELWVRYLTTLTPEQDAEDRRIRQALYETKIARSREKKAQRAQAARDKAAEEEAAAQVASRARRPPRR